MDHSRDLAQAGQSATAAGAVQVPFAGLGQLWLNAGSLCNITCAHCYMESSPENDRLSYLTVADVVPFLDQAPDLPEVVLTGGEPFMNPDIIEILRAVLARAGHAVVLTNGMGPMQRPRVQAGLLDLLRDFGPRLVLRVSLDHFRADRHDGERRMGAFARTVQGIDGLLGRGFRVEVAGRGRWPEDAAALRAGYAALFAARRWPLDAFDPAQLSIPAEIGGTPAEAGATPACATGRMVVRRKGAAAPVVLACPFLPYDPRFEMGATLAEAARPVTALHPHCAACGVAPAAA
ncbi:hypothetical protein CCR83_14955 [Rhodobacter veldkampii DSM 11550]|uniref:Radical SAM protein n=1 Tax=Phaeovulum veldkampii DSM 11550 TaxID=1185920 RepID=A0A2T4JHY9_9RHOB|nr:radical SAM protein [Phaeovulum veldkampii]MBK5947711.1 hypothetical protein [Phaeovulum veldkampii DSM 11550]PTE17453.1 radical SAM protein [Phaeovulum veldkampii DSM 11550]TDQ60330.1 4Fe-4S single cluster protein [Phaeovulum veldkampii DSM 11550]